MKPVAFKSTAPCPPPLWWARPTSPSCADGTVAAYLEGQDARPSMEGYGIYARLYYRIEQFFRQRLAGA